MPDPKRQKEEQQEGSSSRINLQFAIRKLSEGPRSSERRGLSDEFKNLVKTEAGALTLCEKAMESLATSYIRKLAEFQEATSALDALSALEAAEQIWKRESGIIQDLDRDGQEKAFLLEMRTFLYQACEKRLKTALETYEKTQTAQDLALPLGLLSTMDGVLEEQGQPKGSPQRLELSQLAKSLA